MSLARPVHQRQLEDLMTSYDLYLLTLFLTALAFHPTRLSRRKRFLLPGLGLTFLSVWLLFHAPATHPAHFLHLGVFAWGVLGGTSIVWLVTRLKRTRASA